MPSFKNPLSSSSPKKQEELEVLLEQPEEKETTKKIQVEPIITHFTEASSSSSFDSLYDSSSQSASDSEDSYIQQIGFTPNKLKNHHQAFVPPAINTSFESPLPPPSKEHVVNSPLSSSPWVVSLSSLPYHQTPSTTTSQKSQMKNFISNLIENSSLPSYRSPSPSISSDSYNEKLNGSNPGNISVLNEVDSEDNIPLTDYENELNSTLYLSSPPLKRTQRQLGSLSSHPPYTNEGDNEQDLCWDTFSPQYSSDCDRSETSENEESISSSNEMECIPGYDYELDSIYEEEKQLSIDNRSISSQDPSHRQDYYSKKEDCITNVNPFIFETDEEHHAHSSPSVS